MKELYAKSIGSDDTFRFSCSCCGECCRNIRESVMLESLDAYRLAQYLKQNGVASEIEEVFTEYAIPLTLGNTGYPIFVLKTKSHLSSCVFLKNGKCSIYQVRPRACRLYPLSAKPGDKKGTIDCYVVSQNHHHFNGCERTVSDWMDTNFDVEARDFIEHDYHMAETLGKLYKKLRNKGVDEDKILYLILFFKYFNFDVDRPFMPQFFNNNEQLIKSLERFC